MKKILGILFLCFTALTMAEEPIFEETNEKIESFPTYVFAAKEPKLEENDVISVYPKKRGVEKQELSSNYMNWQRYKANFGVEKVFLRFPQSPAVSQSCSLLTAYAYDHAVLYSLNGYFPPLGHIDPIRWFDEILYSLNRHPVTLLNHVIMQVTNGDWVMDYVAHDFVQNLIIKGRAIVTPFNGYTLQCIKPNGMRDHFDYFLDNFFLKCE